MTKYYCYCGQRFDSKIQCLYHIRYNQELNFSNAINTHYMLKKDWMKFKEVLYSFPWKSSFRLTGSLLILAVLEKHFQVNFSVKESILIGIGLGLIF